MGHIDPSTEIRKRVTIVFCDLAGSTGLGERLDPETLRRVMSRYYDEMGHALEAHGGTVMKLMGDAVMAVFGIPDLHEDDACRAVRATADMVAAMSALNQELERRWDVHLDVRAGVNTGEVVVDEPSGPATEIVGDAVNVAARLEQAATPGDVLIGEETFRLVRDVAAADALEPMAVRGRAAPVRAFRLRSVEPRRTAARQPPHHALVGRDPELETLATVIDQVLKGGGSRLITVLGSAGIGKTRLLQEAVARVGPRVALLCGRCLPYGEGITFWPVAEIVKAVAGIGEQDSHSDALAKIESVVAGDPEAADIAVRLAGAIGVTDPASDREGIFWAVRKLLAHLARSRPVMVLLDDLQWAEPTLLDMVEDMARRLQDAPVIVVALARPELLEERPGWGAGMDNASRLDLEPLRTSQSRELVRNFLGGTELQAEAVAHIASVPGGNPLFLEETLRMLIDDGLLVQEGGAWRVAGSLSALPQPPSIRALLTARIGRLQPGERTVLGRAAVVGQEFWQPAIVQLSPDMSEPEADRHIETLLAKGLIAPGGARFAGADAFRFAHLLIRDAAYEEMLKEVRADLHERLADWMEQIAGEHITEYEEIVGYHLESACLYAAELRTLDPRTAALATRAAERLSAAGRRALARDDVAAAANLLERAMALVDEDDPIRRDALPKLCIALGEMGEVGRADALLGVWLESETRGSSFLSFRDDRGRQHVLGLDDTTGRVTVGRRSVTDVPLEWDGEVSRLHAVLERSGDDWSLVDAGSRNGSFVNGERIDGRRSLHDGDVIRFGTTAVLFRAAPSAGSVTRPRTRDTTARGPGVAAPGIATPGQEAGR